MKKLVRASFCKFQPFNFDKKKDFKFSNLAYSALVRQSKNAGNFIYVKLNQRRTLFVLGPRA
jgi:hypothetical protein